MQGQCATNHTKEGAIKENFQYLLTKLSLSLNVWTQNKDLKHQSELKKGESTICSSTWIWNIKIKQTNKEHASTNSWGYSELKTVLPIVEKWKPQGNYS